MAVKFPRGFYMGFSMSGFQFEMGLEGHEDRNSDWWAWSRDPENIVSGLVSGDLPEHGPGYLGLYRGDHDLADSLGMDAARLAVEWSRVFPRPTRGVRVDIDRDEDGNIVWVDVGDRALMELDEVADRRAVSVYTDILRDWKGRGKTLILNLNHFTLPIWIHDPLRVRREGPVRGASGWLEEETVVEFAKYAAYIAWKLGGLVDYWSTMNEPTAIYQNGYLLPKTGFPPGLLSMEYSLRAARNLATAHARAYDAIKERSGRPVGIIYVGVHVDPLSERDEQAAETARRALNFEFIDSITRGESAIVGARKDLSRRLDWLGVNYYTRVVVREAPYLGFKPVEGYGFLCSPGRSPAGRPCSDSGWEVYPEGLGKLLLDYWERYGVEMIVTENGVADSEDRFRPRFIASHLREVHEALSRGAVVLGYLHWSLTDNYEWASGFRMRFGLAHVDYRTKRRYLRPSALVFREIARAKAIPEPLEHLAGAA